MQHFTYQTVCGENYEHEAICISHMFDHEFFIEEMEYEDIPIKSLDEVESVTMRPLRYFRNWGKMDTLYAEYRKLVQAYLGQYLNPDFSFTFTPYSSKLYVLFFTTFIRNVDEEGDWFMEYMLKVDGPLMRRLWITYQENQNMMWVNWLHQSMGSTITSLPNHTLRCFEDNMELFIESLKTNNRPIVGSDHSPMTVDTMDYAIHSFLEEVGCPTY